MQGNFGQLGPKQEYSERADDRTEERADPQTSGETGARIAPESILHGHHNGIDE